MNYRYFDGFEFTADTPEGICRALMGSMHFSFDNTLEEWMRNHAIRCNNWNGKKYSTGSFDAHVADLLRHGILEEG